MAESLSIPPFAINMIAGGIYRNYYKDIVAFYDNPVNVKAFEEWKARQTCYA